MLRWRGFPLCETSLLCCWRLIRCAGYGSFGVGLLDLLMKGANRSIGIGRMVVVLCSLEISFIVCKKRSCRATVAQKSSMPPARVFPRHVNWDRLSPAIGEWL